MRADRHRWPLGVGSLLLCTITMAVRSEQSHPQSLIDRATKVADVQTWNNRQETFYRWLSDHEVMFVRPEWNFFRYDLSTGADTPMTDFTSTFLKSDVWAGDAPSIDGLPNGVDSLELSHDGKWALWSIVMDHAGVSMLDGSHLRQWTFGLRKSRRWGISRIFWLGESQQWAEIVQPPSRTYTERFIQVRIYAVDQPHPIKTFHVRPEGMRDIGYIFDRMVAPIQNGVMVRYACNVWGNSKVAETFEWQITDKTTIAHHHMLPLPPGTHFLYQHCLTFSPAGDKIAWTVESDSTSTAPEFSIWISGVDGSDMHLVGAVAVTHDAKGSKEPHSLRWLPDDKRLSFVYNNALFTLPVD